MTTLQLHERALADLGAFVHRAVIEDEAVHAVRCDLRAPRAAAGALELRPGGAEADEGQARAR